MTWLIAIVCVILVVVFWRIFLPLALIAAVGLGLLVLYVVTESNRSERQQKLAEQTVREKIAKAKAAAGDVVREWEVLSETDPASGEKVPRYAGVVSDDGLCRLQIEERINRARLAAIYCSGLKISPYHDVEVKFDNRSTSDTMRLDRFSDGDAVYIPSYQYSGQFAYDEFLRRMIGANKVALLLTVEAAGRHWITFSLKGSGPALTRIGAVPAGDSGPPKSHPKKSGAAYQRPQSGTPTLPANARLNILGNDWECVRGYRRSGDECIAVQVPPNARLNVLGNDWECQRGYQRSGPGCTPVRLPENAQLNVLGNDWECRRGFRRQGSECVAVQLPRNAKLNILGNDWECIYGYRRVANECVPVGSAPAGGR